jgi:hypothetical protein
VAPLPDLRSWVRWGVLAPCKAVWCEGAAHDVWVLARRCACGRQVEYKLALMKDNFLQYAPVSLGNAVEDASLAVFWHNSGLESLYWATRGFHFENDTLPCYGGCGMGRARPYVVAALMRNATLVERQG